jgi:RNA polymerase sigma factor (sigma-70 family)
VGFREDVLSFEAELALIVRFQAGDNTAGEALLKAHRPLIEQQVWCFLRTRYDIEHDDLAQEARMSFLKAVRRFDSTRRCSLGHYAYIWLRSDLRAFVLEHYTVQVATKLRTDNNQLFIAKSDEEKEIIRAARRQPIHLDALVGEAERAGGNSTLLDYLASPARTDDLELADLVGTLIEAARLSERETQVLRRRFGADEETFGDIGADFGCSPERVRQLEQQALAKIRRVAQRLGLTPAPATVRERLLAEPDEDEPGDEN